MNYSLEDVKNYFYKYNIKLVDGNYVAFDRQTKVAYTDPSIVSAVKFSHTWVKASIYNRSRTTTQQNEFNADDFQYAFGPSAKEVYDSIMAYSQQALESFGRFYRPDALKQAILNETHYKYAENLVDGLYQSERYSKAFEDWVRYSTGNEIFYPKTEEYGKGR